MSEWSDRVVVVTGANGNLGSFVTSTFQEHGARVVRLVRSDDGLENTLECDVTSEESVTACFDQIRRQHTSIYVLIHTVGTWKAESFESTQLNSWEMMMRLNLTSTFLCFREAIRSMGSGGRLVAIASKQGADGGVKEQASYSASKGAVVRLVESVADEFGGRNINANAIAPYQIAGSRDAKGAFAGDIARTCLFLCSDTAAAITGATIRMYG